MQSAGQGREHALHFIAAQALARGNVLTNGTSRYILHHKVGIVFASILRILSMLCKAIILNVDDVALFELLELFAYIEAASRTCAQQPGDGVCVNLLKFYLLPSTVCHTVCHKKMRRGCPPAFRRKEETPPPFLADRYSHHCVRQGHRSDDECR